MNASKLRQPFLWPALASALAIGLLCVLCLWGMAWHRGVPTELGWDAYPTGEQSTVTYVDPGSPAFQKLKPGDQIAAVNGSRLAAHFGPVPELTAGAGSYSIDVRRSGKAMHFDIALWRRSNAALKYGSFLLIALLNLGLAIWIGVARPDYAAARVAFFLFLGTAMTFASAVLLDFYPPLSGAALGFALVVTSHAWRPVEWAVAYDFSLRFPESIAQPRLLRLLRIVLYAAASLLCGIALLPQIAQALYFSSRAALLPVWFRLAGFDVWRFVFADTLGALALFAIPLVLASNYRKLPDELARTKLRWVALAICLAVLPVFVGVFLRLVLARQGKSAEVVVPFLNGVASFATLLLPAAVTYAIVKHRIMGIGFVIRRGVQYLLARNVLRLILYLPMIAIAADLVVHSKEPLQDVLLRKSWWLYLFFLGSVALSLRYRTRLITWVDKRFFRSAYEEQVILSELIESMQCCENLDEVARAVALRVESTLQPSTLCVLFRDRSTGRFNIGYELGSPLGQRFRAMFDERLRRLLQSERTARTFSEFDMALKELVGKDDDSGSFLEALRDTLLTPIQGGSDDLLGVLLMGEKKSEQAYSKRDRQLLQALATQIGLVLEMLGLKEQVREEGRVRLEVLGRLDQEQIQLVLECPTCGRCYSGAITRCETDGAVLGMTLPIERIIDGKYRLEQRIGAGGMGAVYEAADLRLDRRVAIKVMTGRLFGNTAALRRFEREARAVARLQHANIVSIYDFGTLRGDGAYLVMQLLPGRSWRAELRANGAPAPTRAAAWFDQLCEAISYAHLSGIVHRDLKPENVLLSGSEAEPQRVTVVDFGLAKLQSQSLSGGLFLSTEDAVMGTYGYMSPEQRAGEPVDHRTDIYSLGVMVAETLTNSRPPLSGASREWLASVFPATTGGVIQNKLLPLLNGCLAETATARVSQVSEFQGELIGILRDCPPLMRQAVIHSQSAHVGGDGRSTRPMNL